MAEVGDPIIVACESDSQILLPLWHILDVYELISYIDQGRLMDMRPWELCNLEGRIVVVVGEIERDIERIEGWCENALGSLGGICAESVGIWCGFAKLDALDSHVRLVDTRLCYARHANIDPAILSAFPNGTLPELASVLTTEV